MIKNKLRNYLNKLEKKNYCLSVLLSKLEIVYKKEKYVKYSREYSKLANLVTVWKTYQALEIELNYNKTLYNEKDLELRTLIIEEINNIKSKLFKLKLNIKKNLKKNKNKEDKHGVFLEIRAGAGGSEAALFSGDLFRMYCKYAEKNNWQIEVISFNSGEYGGFKEIILRIKGYGIYGKLKFESGTHRVQRIPNTESIGRIHTSTCTVVVMAEIKKDLNIKINIEDLRIDTYRSSGAGGQHVNTTDSAVRITHLPTNIVVECQTERSQHSNKERAMKMLKTKIYDYEKQKSEIEKNKIEKNKAGICWGNQIRSYILDAQRIKDLRTGITNNKCEKVLNGELDFFIEASLKQGF